ncbi:MAG TPA: hypothetical protein VNK52_04380 [Hyphomicrobiaceae bacterium]|nr:hypothetical protein [Hyphomicrobiaceae bacterium]
MALARTRARPVPRSAERLTGWRLAILARVACEQGVTCAELSRSLGELLLPSRSAAEQKPLIESEIKALADEDLVVQRQGVLEPTPAGIALVETELGANASRRAWEEVRDSRLLARALGIDPGAPSQLKALARADQLRAHVLAQAFGFKLRRSASPAQVRARLADVALERAFGNRIKAGLGSRSGLPAKTARLLAGQLLRRPRNVGTDSRLIALLAAEQVGASGTGAPALRLAVLRQFCRAPATTGSGAVETPPQPAPKAPAKPAVATRPDLPGFAREVQVAARTRAEGWPGNRKAFICHVWQAIAARHPGWGLSEIEFKAMLAEAHRTGHLALASADLKDRSQMKEFQASAIPYKNMVWHFVRVED